jgi:predicted ATPase/DNA-binding winged helix-turn-helix (wHTH) protein
VVSFGPFKLEWERHVLLRDGQPVRIGGRALDILKTLVEHSERLVTKDELVARVWPNVLVDEGNLRTQIALLRRVLGQGENGVPYVSTVSGRGYRFAARISVSEEERTTPRTETRGRRELPFRLTRPVGRTEIVREIVDRVRRHRLLTIVGPGGIGKTTVALAAAAGAEDFSGGACFIDLAPLTDPALVKGAALSALGNVLGEVGPDDGLDDILSDLGDRHLLVILDNCEHVIEESAVLVERLLRASDGVHVIATSREPLLAEGEHVYRLPPLEAPPATPGLTAEDALAFPAVQLFVERAASERDDFTLADGDAPAVAEICRRLDGMALAIELAAGQVGAFGIRGVADRLDDRFRLLMRGRRTAMARHQTLGATLDWSYSLLSETERHLLCRLSIFVGRFDLEAACAVGADADDPDIFGSMAALVGKSLLNADVRTACGRYHLLDTTRTYGRQKLGERGEAQAMARRHALYLKDRFDQAETEATRIPAAEWLAICSGHIDDVRAALRWAFSPDGDAALGVCLTAAALPLWLHLSLHADGRAHIERGLDRLDPDAEGAARLEMRLLAGLGATLRYSRESGREADTAWSRALTIADHLDDHDHRLRALWGLWMERFSSGQHQLALEAGERLREAASRSGRADETLIGERLVGLSHYYLGHMAAARRHLEQALAQYSGKGSLFDVLQYNFDQRVAVRSLLASVLWVQGYPDRAMREARTAVEEAEALDHAMSLALALERACKVALLAGNFTAADRFVVRLADHARRHGLHLWEIIAECCSAVVLVLRGQAEQGLVGLRRALARFPGTGFEMRQDGWRGRLAEVLGLVGEIDDALAIMDDLLERTELTEERFYTPEFLGRRGELLRLSGGSVDAAAEETLLRARDWAREQGALAWELRAMTSLAQLWRDQGRREDARAALAQVYGRFTEGFDTGDLQFAARLIEELSVVPIRLANVGDGRHSRQAFPPNRLGKGHR